MKIELNLDIDLVAGVEDTDEIRNYCVEQIIDRLCAAQFGIVKDNDIIAYIRFEE